MLGLIKKDLLLAKKAFGWFHAFPIAIILVAHLAVPEMLASTLAVMVFFVFNSLVVATFDSDYRYKWELTVRSLPISTKHVVASKYILALLFALPALLAVIVFEAIIVVFFDTSVTLSIIAVCAGLASVQIYNAVVYPVVYRYGPSKMQAATIIYVALIMGVLLVAYYLIPGNMQAMLLSSTWLVCAGILGISAVSFGLSYIISLRLIRTAHEKQ